MVSLVNVDNIHEVTIISMEVVQRKITNKRLYAQLRAIYRKVARQRHDFYHKLTAILVSRFAFLGTEELASTCRTARRKKQV